MHGERVGMVFTVDDGFKDYLRRLAPLGTEMKAAKGHYSSVESSLKNNLPGARLIPTGSFGNGTALKRYSDADYFVIIPRGLVGTDSLDVLQRVRTVLRATFPRTGVAVRTPAVIVPFGAGGCESIDVVPALFAAKTSQGHAIYDIPDRGGRWMRSSPVAHKAYVTALDNAHGRRVKPLVMLVKAWKAHWDVPMLSFYLEMRVARYAATVKTIDYGRGIETVLGSMIGAGGLAALRDPMDIAGYIRPCATAVQEKQALTKVRRGLARASDARRREASGHVEKAFERWNVFFNGSFPAYK